MSEIGLHGDENKSKYETGEKGFFLGLSRFSPPEIIAPHNGIITMIVEAIDYLTTKLAGGAIMGKTPF